MRFIGGKFGLPKEILNLNQPPQFLSDDPLLLFNARACIKIVVDSIKPKICWVPSYLCPSIITAIDPRSTTVRFYPINEKLEVSSREFLEDIHSGDLFLYIDYFGFPFEETLIEELQKKNIVLLQDCSQALFMDHKISKSDYCFYSPRKFLGVPDGGVLHAKNHKTLTLLESMPPPEEILNFLINAVVLRREFDLFGKENNWSMYFKLGDSQFTPKNYRMSDFTRTLLSKGFNYNHIKSQRRNNFQILQSKLCEFTIFQNLPQNVIPLGFPIRIKDRDKIQNTLFQKYIYPPIHWDLRDLIGKKFQESLELSQNILTLPCDQRYQEEDMEFIADSLLGILR